MKFSGLLFFFPLALILLFNPTIQARVSIPQNLDKVDRQKVLEVLGFGTNGKVLSDPYPLGGYAGFEAAIQVDTISVKELSSLGDTVAEQDFFNYPIISVGKGLYNNIDAFIHFIPSSEGTGISEYGGILRWGFYQMAYFPISFSMNINVNSANINDQLVTKNFGYDLCAGITTPSFYSYLGIGETQSQGEFIGGAEGLTDSGINEDSSVKHIHSYLGVGFRIQNLFVTTQMDYYTQPNYSLKLGFRY